MTRARFHTWRLRCTNLRMSRKSLEVWHYSTSVTYFCVLENQLVELQIACQTQQEVDDEMKIRLSQKKFRTGLVLRAGTRSTVLPTFWQLLQNVQVFNMRRFRWWIRSERRFINMLRILSDEDVKSFGGSTLLCLVIKKIIVRRISCWVAKVHRDIKTEKESTREKFLERKWWVETCVQHSAK